MRQFFEFMSVALPWIATGLLLAVFLLEKQARKRVKIRTMKNDCENRCY